MKTHVAIAYLYLKDANKQFDKGKIDNALKYTKLVNEHLRKASKAFGNYMKLFAEG
jgi:hypothetical protein